jgi:hypothetical protein
MAPILRAARACLARFSCCGSLLLTSALLICYGFIALFVRLAHIPYVPVCPFKLLSGLDCPLCGATRSLGCLLTGDVTAAWAANKPAPIGMLIWGVVLAFHFCRCLRSRRRPTQ